MQKKSAFSSHPSLITEQFGRWLLPSLIVFKGGGKRLLH